MCTNANLFDNIVSSEMDFDSLGIPSFLQSENDTGFNLNNFFEEVKNDNNNEDFQYLKTSSETTSTIKEQSNIVPIIPDNTILNEAIQKEPEILEMEVPDIMEYLEQDMISNQGIQTEQEIDHGILEFLETAEEIPHVDELPNNIALDYMIPVEMSSSITTLPSIPVEFLSPVKANVSFKDNKPKTTISGNRRISACKLTNNQQSSEKYKQILENAGLVDHKPARGRGRSIQLNSMTSKQKNAETNARMQKNRVAARECRLRRKEYVLHLENKVEELEKKNKELKKMLQKFK